MTTIEKVIEQLVLSNTDFAQIVGDRLYGGQAPQHPEYPMVVYQTTTESVNTSDGPTGTYNTTLTISIYTLSDTGRVNYIQAKEIALAIGIALNGIKGTSGTIEYSPIQMTNQRDVPASADAIAEDRPAFMIEQTYTIYHT